MSVCLFVCLSCTDQTLHTKYTKAIRRASATPSLPFLTLSSLIFPILSYLILYSLSYLILSSLSYLPFPYLPFPYLVFFSYLILLILSYLIFLQLSVISLYSTPHHTMSCHAILPSTSHLRLRLRFAIIPHLPSSLST